MGIHDLNKLIKKYAPQCVVRKHVSEFHGIAIDCNQILTRYIKRNISENRYQPIYEFLKLVNMILSYDVQFYCVFDGHQKPFLKNNEMQKRKTQRLNVRTKYDEICSSWNEMLEKIVTLLGNDENLEKYIKKCVSQCDQQYRVDIISNRIKRKLSLLRVYNDVIDEVIINVRKICLLNIERVRFAKSTRFFHYEDLQVIRDTLMCLGVTVLQSFTEADLVLSMLAKRGLIDGIMSYDTDMLPHGVKYLIRNINVETGYCDDVISSKILFRSLGLNYFEFIDLCIILGTDYNRRLPGCGIAKAYEFIKEYHSIEGILFTGYDNDRQEGFNEFTTKLPLVITNETLKEYELENQEYSNDGDILETQILNTTLDIDIGQQSKSESSSERSSDSELENIELFDLYYNLLLSRYMFLNVWLDQSDTSILNTEKRVINSKIKSIKKLMISINRNIIRSQQ